MFAAAPAPRSALSRRSLTRCRVLLGGTLGVQTTRSGMKPNRLRRLLGFLSLALMFASLALIWLLTEQSPTQTGELTRWFVNVVDDVQRGDAGGAYPEALSGSSGQFSYAPACSIVQQPRDCGVRIGDLVVFQVVARGAVAYLWECTDPGTPGWYQISGVVATRERYEFEMTEDRAWMDGCRIRCLVTFADGSSDYTDEVHIDFRDVMENGKLFRRVAHIIEFGSVGLFAALSATLLLGDRFPFRVLAGVCFGFCAANSLFDQLHKLFVPGREFDVFDLGLDAISYVLAISFVFGAWGHLHRSPDKIQSTGTRCENEVWLR